MWSPSLPVLLLIAVGLWAYQNSVSGPFIFDDLRAIVHNPHIRDLWPFSKTSFIWSQGGIAGRPALSFTLALQYAVSGLAVWPYHAANLLIHLLAALTLFGIVRRTLLVGGLSAPYGGSAAWLAATVALLWVTHPLQTQSVTYLIQRAESLTGFFYLLTLYCVIRSATSLKPRRWWVAAVGACALGMGTKPVMVTAPALVLLYDRVFLAGTWRNVWRLRQGLYVRLAATWVLLAILIAHGPHAAGPAASFPFEDLSPAAYARTQPGVILHYVRLAFYPHPLVLDYYWPVAQTVSTVVWPSLGVGALILVTLWAWRVMPALGFLGAWFFLILAPSSSVIPLADLAAEHRMYLPLVTVIVLCVLSGYEALQRFLPSQGILRRRLGMSCVIATVATLGTLTTIRNEAYRSELAIWRETVASRPDNPRAHFNLATALDHQGNSEAALAYYAAASQLWPGNAIAQGELGALLLERGKVEQARHHLEEALRVNPDAEEAHNNLGLLLSREGKLAEAIAHYREALRLKPELAEAHHNLADLFRRQGRFDEAIAHYTEALRLKPDNAVTHNNLGVALGQLGDLEGARRHFTRAVELNPDHEEARKNLELSSGSQR